MQMLDDLNAKFAVRDHVSFHEEVAGLIEMRVVTQTSSASIYLYGAHLTHWTPHRQSPVFYLSPKTALTPGKPIRGGIPVLFPWFGPRWNAAGFDAAHGVTSPMHGFARTSVWTLDRVHLSPDGEVHATLSLDPSEVSRSFGYDSFHTTLEFRIGAELHMALTRHQSRHGPDGVRGGPAQLLRGRRCIGGAARRPARQHVSRQARQHDP